MAARESKKVIYAAIVANLAIAAGKYTAAALTGSSAMLRKPSTPRRTPEMSCCC
jgi:divalent metal cation (Fe/Co/Zn/Cd) transporter